MVDREGYTRVTSADAVEEGQLYPCTVGEEQRLLTKVDGRVHAIEGICTHEFAELADGDLEGEVLWCPLHASGFDVRTGAVTSPPAQRPLKTYDVRIEDDQVYVSREPTAGA